MNLATKVSNSEKGNSFQLKSLAANIMIKKGKQKFRKVSPLMSFKWMMFPKHFKELKFISECEKRIKSTFSIDNLFKKLVYSTMQSSSSPVKEYINSNIPPNKSYSKECLLSHSLSNINLSRNDKKCKFNNNFL